MPNRLWLEVEGEEEEALQCSLLWLMRCSLCWRREGVGVLIRWGEAVCGFEIIDCVVDG
jgi:hypothetical protein